MSEFFDFIKANRPKIGLVDFYDLGEIYTDDQRDALSSIFLDPDALDQIYKLSSSLSKEDVRTMGGLETPVIHSLAISDDTLRSVSFDISQRLRTDDNIGEPGKHSFSNDAYSDNIITFHGGIAANNIEYNFLDEFGEVRTTTVPTSRESLFNSIKNTNGQFTLALYPSLFRARRRSHVNQIRLTDNVLIPRERVTESPTDLLKIPVYMRTDANTNPNVKLLQCYATKNSPLVLPVKISNSASVVIERTSSSETPFVFGWELRRLSDGLLVRSDVVNSANTKTVTISIDTVATPGQGADCDLYIYLDPTQVEFLTLEGLGMTERAGRDIGLVGFDNLKKLYLNSNGLSTYPVWLKTLNNTIEILDVSYNSYWNNGIVRVFDYQDLRSIDVSGRDTTAPPSITGLQVLAYSGYLDGGVKISDYDGSYVTAGDSAGALYKDLRASTLGSGAPAAEVTEENGFRVFPALKELILGSTNVCYNADFSYIFPNLENISARSPGNEQEVMYGLIPRLNNSGQLFTIDYYDQTGLGGSIANMGRTLNWKDSDSTAVKNQFVGRFKIKSLILRDTRVGGGFLTISSDAGTKLVDSDDNVAEAWEGWLTSAVFIDLEWKTKADFRVAYGQAFKWTSMAALNINHCWTESTPSRVIYNSGSVGTSAVDILTGTKWDSMSAYNAGWAGKLFSIAEAPSLKSFDFSYNSWSGYPSDDTTGNFNYLFPDNFTDSSKSYALQTISLYSIVGSESKRFILRKNEFENLPKLTNITIYNSNIFGDFPTLYENAKTAGVNFSIVHVWGNNFKDLSSLGSSTRIQTIYFVSQGTNYGGALTPLFNSSSGNSVLSLVHGTSSLPSNYPGNWSVTEKRNTPIDPLFTGDEEVTAPPDLTWSIDSYDPKRLLVVGGNSTNQSLSAYIMVGDDIISGGTVIGRVAQLDVNNKFIYSISVIQELPSSSLSFRRRGQDISGFFDNYINLTDVAFDNMRITGATPYFKNSSKLTLVNLTNNLITDYTTGSIGEMFKNSNSRARGFNLALNPLSIESIKSIIEDCYLYVTSAGTKKYNITITLTQTKYNSSTRSYVNWSKDEIFNGQTVRQLPDPTEDNPNQTRTEISPDPLKEKFDRMGPGSSYPLMKINLF